MKGKRNVTTNLTVASLFVPMRRFTVSGCLNAGQKLLMPIALQSVALSFACPGLCGNKVGFGLYFVT